MNTEKSPKENELCCPICRNPLAGRKAWAARGKVFCEECYLAKMDKPNLARMEKTLRELQADTLENRRRELREAINMRDSYRREADAIKNKLREDAYREVFDEVRKMPFFKRLMFCFNPFGR